MTKSNVFGKVLNQSYNRKVKPTEKTVVDNVPQPTGMLFKAMGNTTTTDNGALSNKSTLSDLLDFFSKVGAMRQWSDYQVWESFQKAFSENPVYAVRALFWARDIRGEGSGERKVFRNILLNLTGDTKYKTTLEAIIKYVPEYGRWDDLWCLLDTNYASNVITLVEAQLNKDGECFSNRQPISLLAKWLPSENASNKDTIRHARIIRKGLGGSSKEYRQLLSRLRDYLHVVEVKMSAGQFDKIDFSKVPSKATSMYRKAFKTREPERYAEWLESVSKGESKINASTVYPYDIIRMIGYGSYVKFDATAEAQWKALPDYIGDDASNVLCVVDVSGSMTSGSNKYAKPLEVALGLGIYCAERLKGIFKDNWITFSSNPSLQQLKGKTLQEKIQNIDYTNWQMSTDLKAVFELVLNTAVKHRIPESEMPSAIVIISDMQFNAATGRNTKTNLDKIRSMYKKAGYDAPTLIFWNVDAGKDSPATMNDEGVILTSGASPAVFQSVIRNLKNVNPYSYMLDVLNSERYSVIN